MNLTVSPVVFKSLQSLDVEGLAACDPKEIRPILPCLVRMSLISPVDFNKKCIEMRKEILTILSGIETVNSIVALLSIDFHALEIEVKREQQLRQKGGSAQSDGLLVQSLQNGLAMEFERSDPTRRLRLVLSEILYISSQIQEEVLQQRNVLETFVKHSDLFENIVYIPEICDVLNIALSELPALLSPTDIAETLLHMKHGPDIICWLVANSPDCFWEVAKALVINSDKLEDESNGGKIRIQALLKLCKMNPLMALAIRGKCVELCRMPALAIMLTLEHATKSSDDQLVCDIVPFISGLLLGNDQQIRSWLSSFIRNRQKRSKENYNSLQSLRDELLNYMELILQKIKDNNLPEAVVVQASSLVRLYCALRGIAGIKLQEEEISQLVKLVTSHPPPSTAGVRFVSLGLCMLIACPSLIGNHEANCVQWVQWLASEEAYLESDSGVTSSFGEMLLLMAIHFHSNQLSSICDLVCSTLGMKVQIRQNNMTRMKHIFTHEIFTEQVVTAHAVKVPVTVNLNANISGFLPVHCIHQLLKSRAFTKHKVPIKDWIYRQLCVSIPPLHSLLPGLVEVYVNSILMPAGKSPLENTNQPITEDEIREVFSDILIQEVATQDKKSKKGKYSLTAQLLILYYLLHYEDVRLSSTALNRYKVKAYSQEFLSELPIKYLLHQAQKDQLNYSGLFSSLLRLLATHFPHLCLVDDWLERQSHSIRMLYSGDRNDKSLTLTPENVAQGLEQMSVCPTHTGNLLGNMLDTPPTILWQFGPIIIRHFRQMLDPSVPRYIQELYKQVWLRLNSVLPRRLWIMTTNALLRETSMPSPALTQENVTLDPLQVLRCDPRVFRCAPLLSVVLRVLESCLTASRSQLSRHLLDSPLNEKGSCTDSEREELRTALVSAQESLAVQILLEACLESPQDEEIQGQIWALREVRSVVCSYLHQLFISEPSLAKLVHFQGYRRELLPVTTTGVPSLHICFDFIPELLSQPVLEKQVFAVDLVSRLALQYSLPKAMSITRLAINTLSTLLSVLPKQSRVELFSGTLDCVVRICEAFPPLVEDVISLLLQLGRVCRSESSLAGSWSWEESSGEHPLSSDSLSQRIDEAFLTIINNAVLNRLVY